MLNSFNKEQVLNENPLGVHSWSLQGQHRNAHSSFNSKLMYRKQNLDRSHFKFDRWCSIRYNLSIWFDAIFMSLPAQYWNFRI